MGFRLSLFLNSSGVMERRTARVEQMNPVVTIALNASADLDSSSVMMAKDVLLQHSCVTDRMTAVTGEFKYLAFLSLQV